MEFKVRSEAASAKSQSAKYFRPPDLAPTRIPRTRAGRNRDTAYSTCPSFFATFGLSKPRENESSVERGAGGAERPWLGFPRRRGRQGRGRRRGVKGDGRSRGRVWTETGPRRGSRPASWLALSLRRRGCMYRAMCCRRYTWQHESAPTRGWWVRGGCRATPALLGAACRRLRSFDSAAWGWRADRWGFSPVRYADSFMGGGCRRVVCVCACDVGVRVCGLERREFCVGICASRDLGYGSKWLVLGVDSCVVQG